VNRRKIFVITERRADYSRFKPILEKISHDSELDYYLVVTGIHLLEEYGHTINEIKKDGFTISGTFNMFDDGDNVADDGAEMARALGRAITKVTYELEKAKPDIILSGFDIAANFAVVIAGAHMNIPVTHIQGGEVTGTIDESIRHAMSKFSHYHFTSNGDAKERLIKMGEVPERVFVVGCPSLDALKNASDISKENILEEFGIDLNDKYIIIIQHPVTTEIEHTVDQITETLQAVEEIDIPALLIYPNNDAGSTQIIKAIKDSKIRHVSTLSIGKYKTLLKNSCALVGNSSSGIHEAATFHVPTVNIGTRQQGRLRGDNIIDVRSNKEEIRKGIEKALFDKRFLHAVSVCKNPYGDGNSSDKIVKLLKEIDLSDKIIQKKMTY
jgi:GDP/UDP-N,N'-diacetylbacillosamine 2-epimerase (hydrolysing)